MRIFLNKKCPNAWSGCWLGGCGGWLKVFEKGMSGGRDPKVPERNQTASLCLSPQHKRTQNIISDSCAPVKQIDIFRVSSDHRVSGEHSNLCVVDEIYFGKTKTIKSIEICCSLKLLCSTYSIVSVPRVRNFMLDKMSLTTFLYLYK